MLNEERQAEDRGGSGLRFWKNAWAFFVFAGMCAALVIGSSGFGLTWDEATYFRFADSVRGWFASGHGFSRQAIATYWGYSFYHNPHPPFFKAVNALFSPLFSGVLPYPASYRMANILYVSGCAALVFRLLASSFPIYAALAGIACAFLQPRVFGHLMIAATDSPVAVSWLAVTVVAWRMSAPGVSSGERAAMRVLFFALMGIAAAAKITGFLVAVPLLAYFAFKRDFSQLRWLFWGSVFALFFVAATTPTMWDHPLDGVAAYLVYPFLRSHEAISTFYLGKIYKFHLPWHYFSVMTLVTFPLLLFLLLPGLAWTRKVEHNGLGFALLFPVLFWFLVTLLPSTPRHDGVRQFVSVYPFLGLFSWLGLLGALSAARERGLLPGSLNAARAACLLVTATLAFSVWMIHPFELSYYNRLIGGIRGAEKRGMEISYYWDAATPGFIKEINSYLQNGATVYMVPPWNWLLQCYSDHGLLDGVYRALSPGTMEFPDYFLVLRRRGYTSERFYNSVKPLAEVSFHGVSLVKFGTIAKEEVKKGDGGGRP